MFLRHKKILIISTYPIQKPESGGQKRSRAIFDYYKNIFKCTRYISITHRGMYENKAYGDEALFLGEQKNIKKIEDNPYISDVICGEAIANDIHVRSSIAETIRQYKPDIIQMEQVYPYMGLKKLLSDMNVKTMLIHSSHNIEYPMKKEIYESLDIDKGKAEYYLEKIKKYEATLCTDADLNLAVSAEDKKSLRKKGAKKTVVVPNGISSNKPSEQALSFWRSIKNKRKTKRIISFIGSDHPPNRKGFFAQIGTDLKFLDSDTKLVIAGGVAEYIKAAQGYDEKNTNQNFWPYVLPVGKISEDRLAGLIEVSDVILLPIVSGGGSNLKTAEAVLSRKKIVASPYAFRGFEDYLKLPNIFVANTSSAFKKAIIKALNSPYIEYDKKNLHLSQKVTWEHCTKGLKKYIRDALIYRIRKRLAEKITRR